MVFDFFANRENADTYCSAIRNPTACCPPGPRTDSDRRETPRAVALALASVAWASPCAFNTDDCL